MQPMSGDASYPGGLNGRAFQFLAALVIGAISIGFIMVKGCQEGPFGRKQFVTLKPDEEAALGAQAYREVLSKSDVLATGPVVGDVERVTRRLTRATDNPNFLRATKL